MSFLRIVAVSSVFVSTLFSSSLSLAAQPSEPKGPQLPPASDGRAEAAQNHVDALNDLLQLSAQPQTGDSADEKAAVLALNAFSPIYDNSSASEEGQGLYMATWYNDGKITVWKENGNHIQVWTYDLATDRVGYTTITPSGRTHVDYSAGDAGYRQGVRQMKNQVDHLLHGKIITTPSSRAKLDAVDDFLTARLSEI